MFRKNKPDFGHNAGQAWDMIKEIRAAISPAFGKLAERLH